MNTLELADQLVAEWNGEGFQPDTAREAASMLRRQHEAIVKLREALTDSLCTLQQVHGYALMPQADVKRVEQSIEYAARELQLTDYLK